MSRKTEKKRRMSAGRILDTGMTYLILLAVAFVFFFPCLWLILASFSKSGTIYSFDGFFPAGYSLASFKRLFTDTALYNYPRWFANTLFVAAGSCILGTFLVILTAYTMSRFTFAARKPMMKITMVLGMFPSFMGMIAVYLLMTQFNLINHLWGLILIYSAGAPMGYLTQKGFFDTIPKAIDEAARIDGATNFQVFMKINLPLSRSSPSIWRPGKSWTPSSRKKPIWPTPMSMSPSTMSRWPSVRPALPSWKASCPPNRLLPVRSG